MLIFVAYDVHHALLQLPIFGSLTELEFRSFNLYQLKILVMILDRAPYVARLRLVMVRSY